MKLHELAAEAIRTEDRQQAERVATVLVHRWGMTYRDMHDWAERHELDRDDFEELLYRIS